MRPLIILAFFLTACKPSADGKWRSEFVKKDTAKANTPAVFAEPSVKDSKDDGYRFTYLRSFDDPITITIQREDEEYRLTAKYMRMQSDGSRGDSVYSNSISLTTAMENELEKTLQFAAFKNLPEKISDGGEHGAEWTLEAKKDGQYKRVQRWSPRSGPFRDACLFMLQISPLKDSVKKIY
jgi:hypothetical protein